MEVWNLLDEADYRILEVHAVDSLSEINAPEELIESRCNDYIFVHSSAAEKLQQNFTALKND